MEPYQEIVDTVPMFFFIWDIQKKETIFISECFYDERIKDYHQPKKAREDLRQYISPEGQADFDSFFESLSPENNYTGEKELKAADNLESIRWMSLKTYPVMKDNLVDRVVGHIRDITREKDNYQLLSEQANSLDVISFMLAHELSAPVSNIMGLTDFLKDKLAKEGHREYLHLFDTVYNFGGEILTLARGLVSLINLQSVKSDKVSKKFFQLRPFLEEELKEFYFRHQHSQIKVEYELNAEVQVLADQRKLRWAIDELLLYLLKVSKENADIFVDAPEGDDTAYSHICIYAHDPNIPKAEVLKVLETSSRLKLADVTGSKIKGMLELVIANEIIQLHGGRLNLFESEDRKGIEILLPSSIEEETGKA